MEYYKYSKCGTVVWSIMHESGDNWGGEWRLEEWILVEVWKTAFTFPSAITKLHIPNILILFCIIY